MNLGQEPMFPDGADDVNPVVMNGISTSTANHDFFSGVGNGYLLGAVEAMEEDDYNISNN
jgi:ribonucleoside-diphosphate reductase beta chain